MAQNEHIKTIGELDVIFDNKKPVNYYGHKGNLSEEDQLEYSERKKAIENKINNQIPALQEEIISSVQESTGGAL